MLQQDYLAHVDIHQGYESGDAQRSAPHVSLIYDDYEYSLFRPSSTPSGDEEDVLFPIGGEYLDDNEAKGPQQVNEHELYYAPLDTVMQRLHAVFPAFKGDGDNEMILDFGILDMQIAEVRNCTMHCFQCSPADIWNTLPTGQHIRLTGLFVRH